MTSANNTVVCTRCEEMVHSNASRCPYCQADLTAPLATRMVVQDATEAYFSAVVGESKKEDPTQKAPTVERESMFDTLVPLFSLLIGGFFFFFALFLKFFSKNGKLILEWQSNAVYFFLVPALLFLCLGLLTLSLSQTED